MPNCLVTNSAGALIPTAAQSDVSTCAYVVFTGSEAQTLGSSPFNLSVEDGGLVSAALLSVWGVAWCFKTFTRTVETEE